VNPLEITLSFHSIIDLNTFKDACSFAELNSIVVKVEKRENTKNFEKSVFVTLSLKDITDLFWIGRFYERSEKEKAYKHLRYNDKITVEIPVQMSRLCELLDVAPSKVVQSFVDDVSLQVEGSNGSDERAMATDYFQRCGYNTGRFDDDEMEEIFYELEKIRMSWYRFGNLKQDEYNKHFTSELATWFDKWKSIKQEKAKLLLQ
jgi:hypothetical protein